MAAERFADFRLKSKDKGLPDPGSSWAWLGLGSALDGISGVTRETTLSDKPHVVYGPQKKKMSTQAESGHIPGLCPR